ncbi:MAG: M48 family metallopeptidase [Gemmatimonadaceae bacterium]
MWAGLADASVARQARARPWYVPTNPVLAALVLLTPAAYSWWTGRRVLRALDDPALPELLLVRQRRTMQLSIAAIIGMGIVEVPALVGLLLLILAVLIVQYPVRRAVYDETWSFGQYLRFTVFSTIANQGYLLYAIMVPTLTHWIAQTWFPESVARQATLGGVLGVASALLYVVWHRQFSRVWLALNQASPMSESATPQHATLLARFNEILDRSGERLAMRPEIHRYGRHDGHVANATALCSLYRPVVAMSDTLLARLDSDEATAIFAHEIAHHEHYTLARLRERRGWILCIALLIAVMPVVSVTYHGGLALAIDTVYLLGILFLTMRGLTKHRAHETESDLRAAELTGDVHSVIRGLAKMHLLARVPRRWAAEVERASTHPSLARRIQALRNHAAAPATPLAAATVVRSTTAGACVALDDARAYWFEGVSQDTPLEIPELCTRARSYRAKAYPELVELRIVVSESERSLRATDLGGTSWSVALADADVAAVQTTLDVVDHQLGRQADEPSGATRGIARLVSGGVLFGTISAGLLGLAVIPTLVSLFLPTAATLAATAAMAIGWVAVTLAQQAFRTPTELSALVAMGVLGLWAAWIAFRWHRQGFTPLTRRELLGSRVVFGLLGLAVVLLPLGVGIAGARTARDLIGNEQALSLAIALGGIGAALLTVRRSGWRRVGGGTLALGTAGLIAAGAGDRIWPNASEVAMYAGRLSRVASAPISGWALDASLSPRGTRFLAVRPSRGSVDDRGQLMEFETGELPARGAPSRLKAFDAALVSERELLVLAGAGFDSLELRLIRFDDDSGQMVAWRRLLPTMLEPRLRVRRDEASWRVMGRRESSGHVRLVSMRGALTDADSQLPVVQSEELPLDTVRGETVFWFADGAALMNGPSQAPPERDSMSALAALAFALDIDATRWTLWRYDGAGEHEVGSVRGAVSCASGGGDDAVCVDEMPTGAQVWRVSRKGSLSSLATMPRRFRTVNPLAAGQLVATSRADRSLAVVDVATRRGLAAALPRDDVGRVRATGIAPGGVVALLSGREGTRVVRYRLEPANATRAANAATAMRR